MLRNEWFIGVSAGTFLLCYCFRDTLGEGLSNPWWLAFLFISLFSVVLGSSLSVVRHADHLAARLGEPYGTLILTLSVTSIEVMTISAVMLHGQNNPTLVRDTLFSVVMIILNGMVGISLLLGGWRYREQLYNLQGANAYMSVIIPLTVMSLIMPDYTVGAAGLSQSFAQESFLVLMSLGLYLAFLAIQTTRHRQYFTLGDDIMPGGFVRLRSLAKHVLLLLAYMLPVVFLTQQLAKPIDYKIETLHVPTALGGVVVALLVATPETIGAVRAARANQMQRSVNIFLGSVLSTIGLTIPAMVVLSHLTGKNIILGLQNSDFVMLILTLTVSVVTFANGRTNILQGLVHLLLFFAYLFLIF